MSDLNDAESLLRQTRTVRKIRQWLEDIVSYATLVVLMLQGLSATSFAADADLRDLTYFRLLCVSEAVRNILQIDPTVPDRQPLIPWTAIRALGNILRHEYGGVDTETIWLTIERGDLTELITAAQSELTRLES